MVELKSSEALQKAIEEFDFKERVNKKDLSSQQDLVLAVMNLVSIEEHLMFSGAKTESTHYYDWIIEIRNLRKELMHQLLPDPKGEEWCIGKHLLAASMRLMEVGTKQLGLGKKEEAYNLFEKSYQLYSLFWGIALKIINTSELKAIEPETLHKSDTEKKSVMKSLGNLVWKIIDCCIE